MLVLGKQVFVGLSTRSNLESVNQINKLAGRFGYQAHAVEMHDCLHLKTAVTRVDDSTLLINRHWVDVEHFEGFDLIEVDTNEPFAANCLPINGSILYPTAFPKTAELMEKRGFRLRLIPLDELAKAEGAVTCCSLIVE